MVTCLYTPRPPLYPEVSRGYDLLSSCVHVSSLVFQYRVLPGLLLPSRSCLDGQVTLRQVRGLWCSACTVQREELWMGRKQWNYFQNQKFSPLSLGDSILGSLVFPFLIELLHPEIQWYQLCFHFLCSYVICFELCYLDANSFTSPRRLRFFKG